MREAYAEHGINPNTWEVHYAPQRYGAVPGDSLMRTCGSPNQARLTVRKLARRLALPRVFFDVVGPEERLARAVGRPLQVGGWVRTTSSVQRPPLIEGRSTCRARR